MMKSKSVIIGSAFFFALAGCHSKQHNLPSIKTSAFKTDSFLVANQRSYPNVRLLKAYHIVLSDSSDEALQHAFGQGTLPRDYNFDNVDEPMSYERKGDTLCLKKLFLVRNRNYRMIPDSLFFSGDTLFIKEAGRRLEHQDSFEGFRFEQMFYELKVSKNFTQIRDYDFTRQPSKG